MNELSHGVSFKPYWWEAAPPPPETETPPATADVVIVGTGFTGVNAALTLGRAGRKVVALDSGKVGFGASTRNGGQIGPGNQKYTVAQLIDRFGREQARRIYREGGDMLAYFKDLIRTENIDCDLRECGRFRGAVNTGHYDSMASEFDTARRFGGVQGFVVEKSDVHREIQSDEYVGGLVLSEDGGIHPGRFHAGLLEKARHSGATFFGSTRVLGYQAQRNGFTVSTSQGVIATRDIIVATNGYTDAFAPHFKNKVIPVGSGIVATEPIGEERVAGLMPGRRVYGETRRMFSYFRPSPDGSRVLFGGHCFDAHREAPSQYRPILKSMLRIFPDLEGVGITHAWSGYVGMSRDQFPHIGVANGVHYAMGYSGTGVTRSTYFGHKVALRLLGAANGATQFDDLAFGDHGRLARRPWAVNAYIRWMYLRDAVDNLLLRS